MAHPKHKSTNNWRSNWSTASRILQLPFARCPAQFPIQKWIQPNKRLNPNKTLSRSKPNVRIRSNWATWTNFQAFFLNQAMRMAFLHRQHHMSLKTTVAYQNWAIQSSRWLPPQWAPPLPLGFAATDAHKLLFHRAANQTSPSLTVSHHHVSAFAVIIYMRW